jgi:hypothetical protein
VPTGSPINFPVFPIAQPPVLISIELFAGSHYNHEQTCLVSLQPEIQHVCQDPKQRPVSAMGPYVKLRPENPLLRYPRRDHSQDPRNPLSGPFSNRLSFLAFYQTMQRGPPGHTCAEFRGNPSLLGTMSRMTIYHMALMVSEAQIACRVGPYPCPMRGRVSQDNPHVPRYSACLAQGAYSFMNLPPGHSLPFP